MAYWYDGAALAATRSPVIALFWCLIKFTTTIYLMLFAALSNAVCLYNASFWPMISAIAFYFHVLSWFIDTVCLFHVLICIMHSAFNLLVFPNAMFTPLLLFFLFIERAMCSPEK